MCGNVNIRICTTTAESPTKNGLAALHNAIFDLTFTKTFKESKCNLQLSCCLGC